MVNKGLIILIHGTVTLSRHVMTVEGVVGKHGLFCLTDEDQFFANKGSVGTHTGNSFYCCHVISQLKQDLCKLMRTVHWTYLNDAVTSVFIASWLFEGIVHLFVVF